MLPKPNEDDGIAQSLADTPVASIEQDPSSITSDSESARTSPQIRTPSLSLSPPPSTSPRTGASEAVGSSGVRRGRDVGGIDEKLQGMHLSGSFSMSKVADAIDDVAHSVDSRGNSFLSPEPSTEIGAASSPSRSPRRRRSSSRVEEGPHDIRDENLTNDRFHDVAFQSTFGEAKNLMSELCNTLGSSSLRYEPDSIMQHLYEQANQLSRFECPPTRTVGFVGDSGVGKFVFRQPPSFS
jgi:hypothetical protein